MGRENEHRAGEWRADRCGKRGMWAALPAIAPQPVKKHTDMDILREGVTVCSWRVVPEEV